MHFYEDLVKMILFYHLFYVLINTYSQTETFYLVKKVLYYFVSWGQ